MADVEVNPFVMRDSTVTLGTDSYQKAVARAELVPSGGTINFYGLTPDAVFTFPEAVTFAFQLEYAQDWGSETSLSRYLYDHIGEIVPATFVADNPVGGGKTEWTFDAAITAGAVGGAVNAVATASVALGVVGKPVPTYVPAAPLLRDVSEPEPFATADAG